MSIQIQQMSIQIQQTSTQLQQMSIQLQQMSIQTQQMSIQTQQMSIQTQQMSIQIQVFRHCEVHPPGTESQLETIFQSVSTDFARLAPTSSPGAGDAINAKYFTDLYWFKVGLDVFLTQTRDAVTKAFVVGLVPIEQAQFPRSRLPAFLPHLPKSPPTDR